MDFSDLNESTGFPLHYPSTLPDELWGEGAAEARSRELSPLYIHRYDGSRRAPQALASHAFWELTFAFSGSGHLIFPDRRITMDGCGAVLIPSGMPHTEETDQPWDTLWVAMQGRCLESLEPRLYLLPHATALGTLAEQLWRWNQRQVGRVGPELDAAARFLLQAILRLSRQAVQDRDPSWLQRVLDTLHNRLDEPLEMSDLARIAGFSAGHFQRRFKAETGETPLNYLTRQRLERALVLVRESDLPIQRIARDVGFPDPLYFSRVFRRHFQTSPTQVRRSIRGTP